MQTQAGTESTQQVINQVNEALNRHDIDALLSLMADDVVFENTSPAPDGSRHVGQDEMRRFWETFFTESPNAKFEFEDQFASEDRSAVVWHYTWDPRIVDGNDAGRVRGVSIYRVRDGKVAEVLSYVKG